jgi:hypothetical protein
LVHCFRMQQRAAAWRQQCAACGRRRSGLPACTALADLAVTGCLQGLSRTLFERLQHLHPPASSMLTVQYRMNAGIMQVTAGMLPGCCRGAAGVLPGCRENALMSTGYIQLKCFPGDLHFHCLAVSLTLFALTRLEGLSTRAAPVCTKAALYIDLHTLYTDFQRMHLAACSGRQTSCMRAS